MKVFVDEDAGSTFALALIRIDFAEEVDYVAPGRTIPKGTLDVDWIPHATEQGMLILSCNHTMLNVKEELRLLIEGNAKVVYLPHHASPDTLVQLSQRYKPRFTDACAQRGYLFHRVYGDGTMRKVKTWSGQRFLPEFNP